MLEILLWVAVVLWIVFFIQMLLNRFLLDDLSRIGPERPGKWPSVSIVVPARNEERSIGEAVSSFCSQDYPDFEVIVVDDCSTDRTGEILERLRTKFLNLKIVQGKDPPEGWLGKPNALEIGKRAANGDWLLFVDADVVYAHDLLRRSMACALDRKTDMLALEPLIIVGGFVEALCILGLYLLIIASFPLFLVGFTKWRLLAAGTGAFNMVRRDALEVSKAFESIRSQVVDDVMLGYKVKGAGYKVTIANAGQLVRFRMYHGAMETLNGFTKNTFPAFRRFWWGIPFMCLLGFIMSFLPYIGFILFSFHFGLSGNIEVWRLLFHPSFLALLFMHATVYGIALSFRLPRYVIFLYPVSELLWWWIFFRSLIHYLRQGVVWRGRTYRLNM